jgi:hypothetical protein
MVGTFFALEDLFQERPNRFWARAATYKIRCAFTTAEMTQALQYYFRDMQPLPADVARDLRRFEGRPIHFCDRLLADLVGRREASVRERWSAASTSAWSVAVNDLKSRLRSTLVPDPTSPDKFLSAGTHGSVVLAQLLHAVMLRGGILDIYDGHVASRLVEKGIFVWDHGQRTVDLSAEPILVEALRQVGLDELAIRKCDYVGDALVSSLLELGPTANGSVLQEAGAWGLLRTSLQPNQSLGLSLLPSIPLPERLRG